MLRVRRVVGEAISFCGRALTVPRERQQSVAEVEETGQEEVEVLLDLRRSLAVPLARGPGA